MHVTIHHSSVYLLHYYITMCEVTVEILRKIKKSMYIYRFTLSQWDLWILCHWHNNTPWNINSILIDQSYYFSILFLVLADKKNFVHICWSAGKRILKWLHLLQCGHQVDRSRLRRKEKGRLSSRWVLLQIEMNLVIFTDQNFWKCCI